MADRVPVFEMHIEPMFRMLDRDHMLAMLDLWDLASVWKSREAILERLRNTADMPPEATGGPWPQEWIGLFERWTLTGSETELGHHLILGTPAGGYTVKSAFGGKIEIRASVSVPSGGYRAWLELDGVSADQRQYTLYTEPPYPKQEPEDGTIEVIEKFRRNAVKSVVVTDGTGRHEFPLP